jgi:hypothetical protein
VKQTSTVLSAIYSVRGRGRDLFAAAERLDPEGTVAKRLGDPYGAETVSFTIKHRAYTRIEGRGELFHGPRP